MPQDYILHKVEKGETISSLARKYQVEEQKIVAANSDTIELIRLEDRWEIRISEDSIIKIPQGEEKATTFIIKGNTSLGIGKTEEFELLTAEETIPRFPSEKISWDFSVEEGGSWRRLQLPQEKIGQKIAIVFKNQKLKSRNIQLEVYIERDSSREKLSELLIALDGEDQAEITKLELLDVNRNLIKRPISYAETLFARAQCTGMEGETLYFSLWEDDAKGAGHNTENEQNFISTKEAEVVNGLAEASFPLMFHSMGPIANQKVATGQKDEGKHHEYYVTATRYEGAEVESSSQNVDVNNPDYIPPPPKPKKPAAPKPKPQSKTPKLIHKDRVNATAKPPASAWKEAKIIQTYIRDTQGKEWKRRPKFGEKICIYIQSENLIGRKVNIKLYDKDTVSNDLLYNKNHKIVANLVQVTIELTKEMQDKGGDFWYQNIFAEVLLYDTQQTVQSQVINVDRINFHIPKPEGVKVVTVKDNKKERDCVCKQYDLIWGTKVSCEFRKKVVEISKRQGIDANLLMAAIALETGGTFSPTKGQGTSYIGLIQFGRDAATSIGTTQEALLKMTAEKQLDYVEKYLEKKKNKLSTLTDFYLAILMPVDCGKGNLSNHVVFDNEYPLVYKNGKTTDLSRSRHYGYRQNPGFMFEGKLHSNITVTRSNGKKQTFRDLHNEKKIWYEHGEKKYTGAGKTHIWEIEKSLEEWYKNGEKNTAKIYTCLANKVIKPIKPSMKKGTWNVIITEKYTGKTCTHEELTPKRNNCRKGEMKIYDHNDEIVLTISDCLLEGSGGTDRMKKNNDTPFGTYKINTVTPFYSSNKDNRTSYGPHPRLVFEPIKGSGDEIDKSGRSAIRIHGGRQEGYSKKMLKRAHGCVRIWDEDAKRLYDWWVTYNKENPNIKPGEVTLKN